MSITLLYSLSLEKFMQFQLLLLPMILLAGASGPPEHGTWEPITALTDEFNSNLLDNTKWHDHNPAWKGRKPALFLPENVSVKDGMLCLEAKAETVPDAPEGYHSFTTASVKAKSLVRYGYFEIRAKLMNAGVCNAFWFYDATPDMWTEIDVFEIGGGVTGKEKTDHTNVHVFHTPDYKGTTENHISDSIAWESPTNLADDFHVYALEWDKEEIKWYVDGEIIRTKKNEYWHQPLYLVFDAETMPDWFGLPDPKDLPAAFQIDYVRSWKHSEKGEI